MALEEYKRKRRFEHTPEPPPKVEKKSAHRYVVQKHRATRLHYDFRLELDGVLKSWAVPKGPSLDPADKRLAMQVEDHPVSYFDFEGAIPQGNYGAGTVMVWDVGTWEPLSPVPVNGKYVVATDKEALAMLAKGDLKFRLHGQRVRGDFALVHMKSRRPGTKGNEWLLIKKQDDAVVKGYDSERQDTSVLSGHTLAQIAGDEDSAQWTSSRPAGSGKLKAAWLADTLARLEKRPATKKKPTTEDTGDHRGGKKARTKSATTSESEGTPSARKKASVASVSAVGNLPGAVERPMPAAIHPMLATAAEKPFYDPDWLFEIKWDGYRAIAFITDGACRLVSRNQNDLTGQFPELRDLVSSVKSGNAILDGEICVLDEQGRASFSLMQQRTGLRTQGRRTAGNREIPIVYYVFDLLYLEGHDLRRVALEARKAELAKIIVSGEVVRYSDHYSGQGNALFEAARQKGLEGILAKRRSSLYQEHRSHDWLKIKITQTIDCVIGGYTDPEGTRQYFGSIVLGLYDKQGQLVHVGQAGTGFDQKTLEDVYEKLQELGTSRNPFRGPVDALRNIQWVKPKLVAEIKFSEWTHETGEGGVKLRAPVYMGLREDKNPEECTFEGQTEESIL